MAKHQKTRFIHKATSTVLDYQGMAWMVYEAYPTPHGFEVCKGSPTLRTDLQQRYAYIKTAALVDYLRATQSKQVELPISRHVIYKMRKSLGLSKERKPMNRAYKWTTKTLALLGTMPDTVLGAKLGITHAIARNKRYELGIKTYTFWDADKLALLGTRPDHELAQMLKIDYITVLRKRIVLKIPYLGHELGIGHGRDTKPARYRNPETGATWSGYGTTPSWLQGKERWRFVIQDESTA
jgi:hypothetical protein